MSFFTKLRERLGKTRASFVGGIKNIFNGRGRINVVGVSDQHGGQTDHAVHERNQFRHLRHLHDASQVKADGAADDHGRKDPGQAGGGDVRAKNRRYDGNGHADHAVEIATTRCFLVRKTTQAQDEKDSCSDIGDGCQICSEQNVEFVKTSTGYGFLKGTDGKYYYNGATEHDIKLMRKHCSPSVQIKAAGGIRTLDQLLKAREWGATRIGASATGEIMNEAMNRFDQ